MLYETINLILWYHKIDFLYQKFHVLISQNQFLIKKKNRNDFVMSKTRFCDITKSNLWYHKFILWYQTFILWYQKFVMIFWYHKFDFVISLNIFLISRNRGARWLSGRVSDSGARRRVFETYRRHVVSLSKALYSPKALVNYPGSGGSVPTWLKNCWLGR